MFQIYTNEMKARVAEIENQFDELMNAGFTRDEALSLLIKDPNTAFAEKFNAKVKTK